MAPAGNETHVSKVGYLLSLLGKKLPSKTEPEEDSDYIDIMSRSNLKLPSKLNESSDWFEPTQILVEDDYFSNSTQTQESTEETIIETYQLNSEMKLNINKHILYITDSLLDSMSSAYIGFDANHTWMMYWLVNCHNVLKQEQSNLIEENCSLVRDKIKSCIVDNGLGGIAGGANQLGHLASAYAAVLTLVSIKEFTLLQEIKDNLYIWIMSLKLKDGSFRMHKNGESDARSTYSALILSSLLNIQSDELLTNCREYLNSCQTFEGGFSGTPGTEAHGGYTFCALASYFLIYKSSQEFYSNDSFNLDTLIRWTCNQQYQLEGGLAGRSNKLVDACYSFWVGGVFAMLETIIELPTASLFSRIGLKSYILRCSQHKFGGFRDKPGKGVDYYHTNYTLMGLSICEHLLKLKSSSELLGFTFEEIDETASTHTKPVNPVFGLPLGYAEECRLFFSSRAV